MPLSRTMFGLCALFVFALIVLTAPTNLLAQSNDEIQEQINASAEQIAKLQSEIAKLQKELNATSQQKQTLQTAIKSLDLNIQKLQKSITLTETQIKQKDKEINGLSGDITTTSGKIGSSQGQVADSLRKLDAMEGESMAVMLLGGSTLSSFFDRAASLETMRVNLQNHIHELSLLKGDLEVSKDTAEDKRKELAALQRKLAQDKQGLTLARAEQSKLLKETQNQESAYQAQIVQKQAEQAVFERTLFELASKLQYNKDVTKIPKGRIFRWPLDNVYVTQYFGRTSDSGRLYASGSHDGIDFRATVGTPVRAALSGTVAEINQGAVAYCQYGKWVLVKHGNGLTTLYAHLSQINVQKGQPVDTGQVLGYAGNTGYATGPHLHFTVYDSSAVSLKQYTCKSGYTVTIPIAPVNAYLDPMSYLPGI